MIGYYHQLSGELKSLSDTRKLSRKGVTPSADEFEVFDRILAQLVLRDRAFDKRLDRLNEDRLKDKAARKELAAQKGALADLEKKLRIAADENAAKEAEIESRMAALLVLIQQGEKATEAIALLAPLVAEMRQVAADNQTAAAQLVGISELAANLPGVVADIQHSATQLQSSAAAQVNFASELAKIRSGVDELGSLPEFVAGIQTLFYADLDRAKMRNSKEIQDEAARQVEKLKGDFSAIAKKWAEGYSSSKQKTLDQIHKLRTHKRYRWIAVFGAVAVGFSLVTNIILVGHLHNQDSERFGTNLFEGLGGFLNLLLPF